MDGKFLFEIGSFERYRQPVSESGTETTQLEYDTDGPMCSKRTARSVRRTRPRPSRASRFYSFRRLSVFATILFDDGQPCGTRIGRTRTRGSSRVRDIPLVKHAKEFHRRAGTGLVQLLTRSFIVQFYDCYELKF